MPDNPNDSEQDPPDSSEPQQPINNETENPNDTQQEDPPPASSESQQPINNEMVPATEPSSVDVVISSEAEQNEPSPPAVQVSESVVQKAESQAEVESPPLPSAQPSEAMHVSESVVQKAESQAEVESAPLPSAQPSETSERQVKVVISEKVTEFPAQELETWVTGPQPGGSMMYEDRKWTLDSNPEVSEWKTQSSWASSTAAASGTAMEGPMDGPSQLSGLPSDGSRAYENEQWMLEIDPNRLDPNGIAQKGTITTTSGQSDGSMAYEDEKWRLEKDPNRVPDGQAEDANSVPALSAPPSERGSSAYEDQQWGLEKNPDGVSGKSGGQAAVSALRSDGSMAYEDQKWGLETDPNRVPDKPDGQAKDAKSAPALSTLPSDGSMAYENQAWALEKDPNRISEKSPAIGFFEYSLKDCKTNPVQTQTDADGNPFENEKGTDCTPKAKSYCGECTHVVDECFPNQTECIDLEYTQLVGVAQDFADIAQDFFQETKQLGLYIISQCLEFLTDDICDPCACREGTTTTVADGAADLENNPVAAIPEKNESKTDGLKTGPSDATVGSMAYEDQAWALEKDPSRDDAGSAVGLAESVSVLEEQEVPDTSSLVNEEPSSSIPAFSEPTSIVDLENQSWTLEEGAEPALEEAVAESLLPTVTVEGTGSQDNTKANQDAPS